jgi:Lambda phage tail tube protein, TTP
MADLTNTFYEGDAFHGYGSQLFVGNGASPETFEAVADVISITPGTLTTAVIEKTHLRSLNAHREKLAGLRDSEAFTVMCNWRPDHESQSRLGGGVGSFTAGGLLAINISREERNYKIVLSDGSPATEWPFRGICTGFTPGEIGPDNKVELTLEFTPVRDYSGSLP